MDNIVWKGNFSIGFKIIIGERCFKFKDIAAVSFSFLSLSRGRKSSSSCSSFLAIVIFSTGSSFTTIFISSLPTFFPSVPDFVIRVVEVSVGALTGDDYVERIADQLGFPDAEAGRHFMHEFYAGDRFYPQVAAAVRALQDRYKVALLTNASPGQDSRIREQFGLDVRNEGQYQQEPFFKVELMLFNKSRKC